MVVLPAESKPTIKILSWRLPNKEGNVRLKKAPIILQKQRKTVIRKGGNEGVSGLPCFETIVCWGGVVANAGPYDQIWYSVMVMRFIYFVFNLLAFNNRESGLTGR